MSAIRGDHPAVDFRNHILVALGGTGGATVREFRKELFQRYRDKRPESVRLEYLYVDSSEDDLNDSESWRVLGSSVQLPNDSRLLIAVPNLRTMIDNAPQYPAISRWVGDPSIWRNYLDNQQGLRAAGGQRRRLGRLLMAANIARFRQQIAQHYNRVTTGSTAGTSGNEGVTFHVICGLAGGTGSGSVVDAVIQIGKFIKERGADKRDRILIYALLPEENPVGGRAERYYFANGYAALLELNALSVGTFLPHDVADPAGRPLEPARFVSFNGCYLFTNKTETGTVYDVKDIPGLLATFLYQKIVAVGDSGKWSALVRQENSENGNPAPEPRVIEGGREGLLAPERSVRFLTFGIKRVAVPEQEIKEFLAFSFARQAILQLRFNHWTDSFGFIELPRNTDYAAFRSDTMLQMFRMTEEHLILSKPVLDSDQSMQWKPIEEFWQVYLSNVFEDTVSGVNKNFVVQELIAKGTDWFSTGYRNVGVDAFYQRKHVTAAQEAREIVRLIEDHLFREWMAGNVAMIDVSGSKDLDHPVRGILQTLRDELEERKTKSLASLAHCEEKEREIQERLDAVNGEYAKVGAIDIFGKRQRLQTEAARVLEQLLIVRTRARGYQYAAKLCDAIVRELEDLTGQITACAAVLQNALDSFGKAITQRCQDQGQVDWDKGFVKFYDAENVRRVTKRLVLDRDVQAAQTIEVRKAVRERMTSQRPTFREMTEQLNVHQLTQLLESRCFEQSQMAHDALGLKSHERLLGLSILDQILAKYPNPEAKKKFAESVIPQASTLARIDLTEASNAAANPHMHDILRRSLTVIGAGLVARPGAQLPPTTDELKGSLQSAPKSQLQNFEFVEAPGQTADLCFVSLTNLMPLRTVEHVAFLRRKYKEIVRGDSVSPEDRLFVHMEGDGTEFPGLFAPTMEEIREKSRGVLLLAMALNLLQEQTDIQTGKRALLYSETDEYGVTVQTVPYGGNIIQACAGIDGPMLRTLDVAVEKRLREDFHHQDKRKQVVERIAKNVQDLLVLCGSFPQHPDFTAFSKAYKVVRTRLLAN